MCDAIAIKIADKNDFLTEDQRVRAQYDHKQATNSILLWKAHLLRTGNQEKAKQEILARLDKGSTLMIIDLAMKFQPMTFRELMDDFFGTISRKNALSPITFLFYVNSGKRFVALSSASRRPDNPLFERSQKMNKTESVTIDYLNQKNTYLRTH